MLPRILGMLTLLTQLSLPASVFAQSAEDTLVTLKGAVQMGKQRFHLLKALEYEAGAAEKNNLVVKRGRFPSLDLSYQANIATANNLIGIFYPSGMLPMTGPPSLKNNYHPATGSAASVLLNWQVLSFGQEDAKVNVAEAEAVSRQLAWKQEVFRHSISVISSYLDLLLTYDQVTIHLQNIKRIEANLRESRVLVNTGIKPGVDSALFLTELSRAKVEWLHALESVKDNQYKLAALIVSDLLPLPADTGFLQQLPGSSRLSGQNDSLHPDIQYVQSLIDVNRRKEQMIKKSYMPKLTVWAAGFARGSGFYPDKPVQTTDGLAFSKYNYGAGAQLSFSIFRWGEVQRQLQQQSLLSASTRERRENEESELNRQSKAANSAFTSSVAVATETRQQLINARYAYSAMQVRYNTGLVNFSDLIQTEYNLFTAELDVKNAYWNCWKALLLQAAVKGDESIFLQQIK